MRGSRQLRYDFKFENSWLMEEDIGEIIQASWGFRDDIDILQKLTLCADKLQRWPKRRKKNFRKEIVMYETEMERTRDRRDTTNTTRFQSAQSQQAKVLIQEEAWWRQRAKMHWLQGGDLNTKFFHLSASARAKIKKLESLRNEHNVMVTSQSDIEEVVQKYFHDLFQPKGGDHDSVLSLISPRVTQEENELLIAPITKEEIRSALFQMHPDKAPGPDGFNLAFFQKFWHICGDEIFTATEEWLQIGYFPSSLNETNICLIPKGDQPSSMKDYRPISLCNVLYKMVSKVLANRLKQFLDKYISEEQSAFVGGRYITDNALIAIEIIHAMKRKNRGTRGEIALKIDISKTYDKVEWGFLKGMLLRMGFSATWVQWILLCVSSVNYSTLVNYEKVGPIHPGRGLRQGDPLSLYIFIIVAEGLTSLIKKSVACGDLHGVQVCRGAPSVSHLLFADDCFIFCRANLTETRKLMEILKTYEEASGQEINLSKSEVFFSSNISRAAQEDLSKLLGVRHVLGTGTYLGLPSMVGRSKKATFSFIKDRVWKRINSWRSRQLSRAGKEIMIKSVLQAIPAYVMNIYIFPNSLINDIERMLNAFWWGSGENKKGIRWMAWDKLARPKEDGGLGFRDFHMFNKAMVAKQGWRIMDKPNSLVARILKARYFPNSNFLDSNIGNNPSFTWRSIWRTRQVLLSSCRWRIGSGSDIKVMGDLWLRGEDGRWIMGPQQQDAQHILEVPLLQVVERDKLIWNEESDGEKLMKLMKERNFITRGVGDKQWSGIWKVKAPPKAKHFLWRLCKECLPTRTRLRTRHVLCSEQCPTCMTDYETEFHVFFECAGIREAWSMVGLSHVVPARPYNDNQTATSLIFDLCRKLSLQKAGKMAMLLWCIWKNRNNIVWNNNKHEARQIGIQAAKLWHEWAVVQGILQDQSLHEQPVTNRDDQRWYPPPANVVKCNVDASLGNNMAGIGWGWCVRNHMGQFILAGTDTTLSKLSVLQGEAMTIKVAMEELIQQGYTHVIFESDSKSVVDAIHNDQAGISEFSLLISHIRDLLVLNPNFKVKFIRRQANMVAHSLARATYSMSNRRTFQSIPSCIATILFNEMS